MDAIIHVFFFSSQQKKIEWIFGRGLKKLLKKMIDSVYNPRILIVAIAGDDAEGSVDNDGQDAAKEHDSVQSPLDLA